MGDFLMLCAFSFLYVVSEPVGSCYRDVPSSIFQRPRLNMEDLVKVFPVCEVFSMSTK